MKRLAVALLTLALLAPPLAAGAQQAWKVYRVGLLSMGTITPRVTMWSAFLDAMRELDYVEGRNLVVRRGAAGDGRPKEEVSMVRAHTKVRQTREKRAGTDKGGR